MRDGDRLFPQALHVEGHLLLPLRQQHASVENARLHHRAQSAAQQLRIGLHRPGPECTPLVVEHAHQGIGEVAGVDGLGIHRRAPRGACGRQVQIGKIGVAAGAPRGLRHMQMKRFVLGHDTPRGASCARPPRGHSPCLRLAKWLIALLPRSIVSRAWSLGPARRQAGSPRRPEGNPMRAGLPRAWFAEEIVTDFRCRAHAEYQEANLLHRYAQTCTS